MRRTCRHQPATIITRYVDWAGRTFTGPDYGTWWLHGVCPYRCCGELLCPVCGCVKGGWGPVGCPCADDRPYPAMRRQPARTPVKSSAARYRPSRRHRATTRR